MSTYRQHLPACDKHRQRVSDNNSAFVHVYVGGHKRRKKNTFHLPKGTRTMTRRQLLLAPTNTYIFNSHFSAAKVMRLL